MNALLDQLRALPTLNLLLYLVGAFAVMSSLAFLNGIKPAYLVMQELDSNYQQLQRLSKKFDQATLNAEIEHIKSQEQQVRSAMMLNIPDRDLQETLPTLLEQLHKFTKSYGLRTQTLHPGEIQSNSDIATVSVSIVVAGPYPYLYRWLRDFSSEFKGASVINIHADKNPVTNGARTVSLDLVIYGR